MPATPSTDRTLSIPSDSGAVFRVGLPAFPAKAPTDLLDYAFDWTAWFADEPGDSISQATIAISPADMTLYGAPVVNGLAVTFWPSGGSLAGRYTASCTLVTENGRTVTRSGTIYVVAR